MKKMNVVIITKISKGMNWESIKNNCIFSLIVGNTEFDEFDLVESFFPS